MSFELKLAFRYLRAGNGGLIRLTAVSAVLGIMLGVGGLIIVQSVYSGFQNGVVKSLLAGQPHITIGFGEDASTGPAVIGAIKKSTNVKQVEPALIQSAIARHGGANEYALLKVNLDVDSPGGARVGRELAKKLGLGIGDNFETIIADQTVGPQSIETRVAEVIDTGIYDYDSVYLEIPKKDYEAGMPALKALPNTYLVRLDDPFRAGETAGGIGKKLGRSFTVRDWRTANQPLFAALSFERRTAFIVIGLVVLISAFGISSTLSLLVAERRPDMAVLRTCGARSRSLIILFFIEGTAICLTGIVGGVVLGLAGSFAANFFGLADIAPEIYSIKEFRLEPTLGSVVIIVLAAMFVSLTAVLIPALRAAKSKPVDLLRNV